MEEVACHVLNQTLCVLTFLHGRVQWGSATFKGLGYRIF